jgi:hypothetical protein
MILKKKKAINKCFDSLLFSLSDGKISKTKTFGMRNGILMITETLNSI